MNERMLRDANVLAKYFSPCPKLCSQVISLVLRTLLFPFSMFQRARPHAAISITFSRIYIQISHPAVFINHIPLASVTVSSIQFTHSVFSSPTGEHLLCEACSPCAFTLVSITAHLSNGLKVCRLQKVNPIVRSFRDSRRQVNIKCTP